MRRWLARILVCLALGAVTTVGVAWGFALSVGKPPAGWGFDGPSSGVPLESGHSWIVGRYESPGHTRIVSDVVGLWRAYQWVINPVPIEQLLVRWGRIGNMGSRQVSEIVSGTFVDDGFGLPFRALWAGTDYDTFINDGGRAVGFVSGIGVGNDTGQAHQRVLPYGPIWPGFLIDTLFYGAIWFGLLFSFGATRATRRALRTRRGRCPMCAYDLRGDLEAGCPECGWNREAQE